LGLDGFGYVDACIAPGGDGANQLKWMHNYAFVGSVDGLLVMSASLYLLMRIVRSMTLTGQPESPARLIALSLRLPYRGIQRHIALEPHLAARGKGHVISMMAKQ